MAVLRILLGVALGFVLYLGLCSRACFVPLRAGFSGVALSLGLCRIFALLSCDVVTFAVARSRVISLAAVFDRTNREIVKRHWRL